VPSATNIAGLGSVEILESSNGSGEGVYVLSNIITLTAGGAPATISNTVYSALPSGFGVLVIPGGDGDGGAEGDDFAAYIEQGVSGSSPDGQQGEAYIIGAELLSGNGAGSATTVAGVVYSALPSGSGVLVVVDGTSTTVAVSSTGDGGGDGQSTSTSTSASIGSSGEEEGADESVVAYAGTASAGRYGMMGSIGWTGYVGVLVVVGMCLVR
jgi:hypothetical protein